MIESIRKEKLNPQSGLTKEQIKEIIKRRIEETTKLEENWNVWDDEQYGKETWDYLEYEVDLLNKVLGLLD